MPTTFTKTVTIPQLDDKGQPLVTADGHPVSKRTLGDFTFRRPNFHEEKEIDVRIARDLTRIGVDSSLIEQTPYLRKVFLEICIAAVIPHQVEAAPDKWDWQTMNAEEAHALYAAYSAGVEELAPKNG